MVIVDSSGSIGLNYFKKSLEDLYNLLSYMCPSPEPYQPRQGQGYNQLGMIQFSTDVQDIFHFGEHKKLADIKNAITSTPYMGATTCTSKALEHVANNHMPKGKSSFL